MPTHRELPEEPQYPANGALLAWRAPEYEDRERTTDWYWSVGIIAIALAVGSFLWGNILFAIFVLLAAGALLLFAIRKPREVEFAITERGVLADDMLYPFTTLDAFWIEDKFLNDTLLIKSKKTLAPMIVIPIQDIDLIDLRETLLDFLPEEELHESFSHAFMERLGF